MNTQRIAQLLRELADAIEGDAHPQPTRAKKRARPEPKINPSIVVPQTADDIAKQALRKRGYRV